MAPTHRRRHLKGSTELTALAHPVRLAILEQLSLRGALTATDLAEALDETPANCSWHLRKLADHGFVEEAPKGPGRRRPWQVPAVGMSWDSFGASPEEVRAGIALAEMSLQRSVDRLRSSQLRSPEDATDWQQARELTTVTVWLTAEELAARNAEILAILERDDDRLTDPSKRPPGARMCELVAWGVPVSFAGMENEEAQQ